MKYNIKQIKSDLLYHDLLNQDNMDLIEFIVMQLLNKPYDIVHNNCSVTNSRLSRINAFDRVKYADLIISFQEYEIILELNQNFDGNLKRNILFALTRIVKFYSKYESSKTKSNKVLTEEVALLKLKEERDKRRDYKNHYYKDIFKVILVNLNWYPKGRVNNDLKRVETIHAFDNPDKGIFLKVINISLDKFANLSYNQIKKDEVFYKLLTIDNYDDLINFTKDNHLLTRYVNDLIKYSKTEKEEDNTMDIGIEQHFRDEAIYDLIEERGIEKSIEKGIEKKNRDIVLNMFNDSVPFKLISKYTKLSINKIKEIINDSDNKKI